VRGQERERAARRDQVPGQRTRIDQLPVHPPGTLHETIISLEHRIDKQLQTITFFGRLPERLRLGPPSCPLTWSFPLSYMILSTLTLGPAVTLADRRHPLRRSPVRKRTGRATPKWLVRALPAELWSGHSRHYAAPKLRTTVKDVAPKVP
jgi:hypothetical protein